LEAARFEHAIAPRNLYDFYTLPARLCASIMEFAHKDLVMDFLYLGLILGFFAISAVLVYGFERLRRPS
jgi:hypothetical protein